MRTVPAVFASSGSYPRRSRSSKNLVVASTIGSTPPQLGRVPDPRPARSHAEDGRLLNVPARVPTAAAASLARIG
ncbi:hypothetical protein GCM10027614_33760 [Micromonospora vulcania]